MKRKGFAVAAIIAATALLPVAANAATTAPTVTYTVDLVSLGTAAVSIILWFCGIPN